MLKTQTKVKTHCKSILRANTFNTKGSFINYLFKLPTTLKPVPYKLQHKTRQVIVRESLN